MMEAAFCPHGSYSISEGSDAEDNKGRSEKELAAIKAVRGDAQGASAPGQGE
jgi:hypothetical protein